MEDVVFTQNVIYCAVFFISGVAILRTLKRFDMQTAYYFIFGLFAVLSLYIPFFFGGRIIAITLSNSLPDDPFALMFAYFMSETLAAPLVFVKTVSTGTALLATVAVVTSFAATICIIVRLVHYACELHVASCGAVYCRQITVKRIIYRVLNHRNTYKTLLRLRN